MFINPSILSDSELIEEVACNGSPVEKRLAELVQREIEKQEALHRKAVEKIDSVFDALMLSAEDLQDQANGLVADGLGDKTSPLKANADFLEETADSLKKNAGQLENLLESFDAAVDDNK